MYVKKGGKGDWWFENVYYKNYFMIHYTQNLIDQYKYMTTGFFIIYIYIYRQSTIQCAALTNKSV